MDKNNKHMDAKEFFRMLDQEPDLQHADLDDFEKEALEGWKMVKDRSAAQSKVEEGINLKLEELIAADKKNKGRTGLYILSIAASLALVIGLFFIFNNAADKEMKVAQAPVNESTGSAAKADANIESLVEETSSDANVKEEKEPLKALEQKPVLVPQEKMLDNEEPSVSSFYSNGPVNVSDTVMSGKYKTTVAREGYINDAIDVTENKKSQVTGNNRKEEEIALKDADNKATGEVASGGLLNNQQETTILAQKGVKQRAVIKAKEDKKAKAKKAEAQMPPAESNDEIAYNIPASDDQSAQPVVKDESKKVADKALYETTTTTESNNVGNNSDNVVTKNNAPGSTAVTANGTTTLANTTPVSANDTWSLSKNPEITAQFKGGQKALDDYIKKNLKVPETCASEEVIVIEFKVSQEGKVSTPKILSKTGHCKDCEIEAKRFVKAMPFWTPAKTAGKDVESKTSITLSFKK